MEETFSQTIDKILTKNFGSSSSDVLKSSPLLQYIVLKTKSAQKGSKSRGSFANLYAIYVLVEDYINGNFDSTAEYSKYEGAQFSQLFTRQRQLPFGNKLQNHALNHRLNEEFKKFFPAVETLPIIRDASTNRYWINESLLRVELNGRSYNFSRVIIEVIDKYIDTKREAFEQFIEDFNHLSSLTDKAAVPEIKTTLFSLLEPNVDARIFEIVSFSILKTHYKDTVVYFGYAPEDLEKQSLKLFKTGRTNANDGGIDFVMKPLGRFFQVTETLDVKKYFLDIEKIERFPITFVVKTDLEEQQIYKLLETNARKHFPVDAVIERYMSSIEEIINIPKLKEYAEKIIKNNETSLILQEVIIQSKVEFNYNESEPLTELIIE